MLVDPEGEFGIVGALIGGGMDLGIQLAMNGWDFKSVDWGDVAISTAVGFVAPGALSTGTKVYKSIKAAKIINSQLKRVKVASRYIKLQGRLNSHTNSIMDNLLTQGAYQIGKQIAKKSFDYPSQTTQTSGK